MSWPHQMWRPFSVVSTVAGAGLKLPEGEEAGQTPLLSQDCYAAPGLPISAIGGGGPPPPPPSTIGVLQVSSITVNPAQEGVSSILTSAVYVTAGEFYTDLGIQMNENTFVTPAASKAIVFQTTSFNNFDTGVACLRGTTWQDVNGNDFYGVSAEVLSTATLFTANPGCAVSCGEVKCLELILTNIADVSSINGVSWASISTAAGTLG